MRGLRITAISVAGFLTSGCVANSERTPVSAVRIGALLPFSGDLAASGINLERPLIMAAEAINAAGGIDGREVAILAVDSNRYFPNPDEDFDGHQETLRAFLRGDTNNRLVAEDERIIPGAGVDAIIGPLVPELSVRLAPEARRNGVVHLAANVSPESKITGKCSFSLFPSFRALGSALGAKMAADGVATAGIVYLADDYGDKLQAQVELGFTSAGGMVVAKSPTITGKDSYVDDLNNVLSDAPDAVALLAPPRLAAKIATQMLASELGQDRVGEGAADPVRWYFAPLLRVEDFPNNVPPGLVNGGTGVAPGVQLEFSEAFAEFFRRRWDAAPTLDAHYLFDAVNVLLLALRKTGIDNPGVNLTDAQSYQQTCANIMNTASGGESVTWRQVLEGPGFGTVDRDIDYVGLTGPVSFDEFGNAGDGLIETWRIPDMAGAGIETLAVDSTQDVLAN